MTNDFTGTADASGTYPVGTTVVTWTATDVHGNTSTCTQNVTVSETAAPTITCAADVSASAVDACEVAGAPCSLHWRAGRCEGTPPVCTCPVCASAGRHARSRCGRLGRSINGTVIQSHGSSQHHLIVAQPQFGKFDRSRQLHKGRVRFIRQDHAKAAIVRRVKGIEASAGLVATRRGT